MRTRPAERSIADFDSASAMLRATALALHGQPFPHLGHGWLPAALVRASRVLPRRVRQGVYAALGGREGVPPERLAEVDLAAVASWATSLYPRRPYPGAFIGATNGALTHVYAAAGVPWLPQTFLVPVRWPDNDPERPDRACAWAARVAGPFLRRNTEITLHHMHDPVQDRLMVSRMAYFRVKYSRLPPAYVAFLDRNLTPGAPVVIVHDTSTWPVTRVAERHVFQAGAQGGVEPEDYQRRRHVPRPDGVAAEAEWGFDPGLADDIRRWAERTGHPVHELRYGMPQHPSAPVADLYRAWLRSRGGGASRLLVESFIVHDPWQVLRIGAVPYWTFFPVRSAAAALEDYLRRAEPYDEIDIMLFSHGVRSEGLADVGTWRRLAGLARRRGDLLGVDARSFPADFSVFARYGPALARLPSAAPPFAPLDVTASVDRLRASLRPESA
jgi:hypothetical protein